MTNETSPTPLFITPRGTTFALRMGLFNVSLILLAIALCLLWFFAGVLYVMTLCRCGSFASFMFIKELFPEVMAVSYLLKWLNAFLLLVMSEIVVLLFLSRTQLAKTKVLLLGLKLVGSSTLHNMPGLLFVLTLMANAEYMLFYALTAILSSPLIFVLKAIQHSGYSLYPEPLAKSFDIVKVPFNEP